ncbi:MAG: allantoinase AllB [Myxococcales bacterium]|nr:allantoinase AllB [Myxococcales bacterium]
MSAPRWFTSRRALVDGRLQPAALRVEDGRIAEVVCPPPPLPVTEDVHDCGDLALLPGIVDTHAHLNEPGRTEWEGFATATRACAAGGITTVVDMPLNSDPVTTTLEALYVKAAAVADHAAVDYAFWGGVVPGNADQLAAMAGAGVCGFKSFLCFSGIDDFPASSEADLDRAMPILAELGVPLLVHAEIESPVDVPADPRRYATYLASRPARFEVAALELVARLAERHRGPVHVVHLSAADALQAAHRVRQDGLPLTIETCPHYLTLAAEDVPDGATEYKCAPPVREAANRERLWQALRVGDIDLVVSDHSPCVPGLKRSETGDFLGAWGGIAGLQLSPWLVWTGAAARGFGLADLARWMCERPAALAGLSHRKGRLAAGLDADFVVFDPDAETVVEAATLRHRWKTTPYLGRHLRGRVLQTWLRGRCVWAGGDLDSGWHGARVWPLRVAGKTAQTGPSS